MQFTCQRTGKCCTHPQIVITLTHRDLWILFQNARDIEELKSFIQFILIEKTMDSSTLVLKTINTSEGDGIFILRKNSDDKCIFYNAKNSSCQIHTIRPQACKNFPFAFSEVQESINVSLVKDASTFCMGIGKGKDYTKEELIQVGRHTIEAIRKYNALVSEINNESKINKSLSPHDALVMMLLVAEKEQPVSEGNIQIL